MSKPAIEFARYLERERRHQAGKLKSRDEFLELLALRGTAQAARAAGYSLWELLCMDHRFQEGRATRRDRAKAQRYNREAAAHGLPEIDTNPSPVILRIFADRLRKRETIVAACCRRVPLRVRALPNFDGPSRESHRRPVGDRAPPEDKDDPDPDPPKPAWPRIPSHLRAAP